MRSHPPHRLTRYALAVTSLVVSLAPLGGCGDDSDSGPDDTGSSGTTTTAGSGGQRAPNGGKDGEAGGRAGSGNGAAKAGTGAGGRSSGTAGTSSAGASDAGRSNTGAGGSGAGGSIGFGGEAGSAGPPDPAPDGKSPYRIECHGDSLDCGDPALRCLGIRDTTQVFGYSCSNPCRDDSDCSDADSGAEASAGCVDFVSSSHCLLVCKDETRGERECPSGMSCYVFPGSPIGYCLWQ